MKIRKTIPNFETFKHFLLHRINIEKEIIAFSKKKLNNTTVNGPSFLSHNILLILYSSFFNFFDSMN